MPITKLSFVLKSESSLLMQSIQEPLDESLPGDDDESIISTMFTNYFYEYKSKLWAPNSNNSKFDSRWFTILNVQHCLDFENKDKDKLVSFELICDESLLDQLFQLYILYGWRVIYDISIKIVATNDFLLKNFFSRAQNCLVYLILKRIIQVEYKARSVLVNNSKILKDRLNTIINNELKIQTIENSKHKIQNPKLLDAIVVALRDVIKAKKVLSEVIDKANEVKKDQSLADIIAVALHDGNVRTDIKDQARYKAHSAAYDEAKKAVQSVETAFTSTLEILKINCPYALLIVDAIDEKTLSSSDKVEELLCEAILGCQKLLNTDLSSLSGISVVNEVFGNLVLNLSDKSKDPLPFIDFDRVKGPDRQLAIVGFEKCHEDARWRAMISDQLLCELGNNNDISRESFEYPVWGQYITSIFIERREIEKNKEFYKNVQQGAAIVGLTISLGVLLFASGGTASPVVGVVAAETSILVSGTQTLIAVGQLANAVKNVRDELRSVDTALADKLTFHNDSASETFAAVGALTLTRKEISNSIPKELIKTLVTSKLASMFTLTQLAIHAYGYYQDIEMMIEIAEDWMPQSSDLVCR